MDHDVLPRSAPRPSEDPMAAGSLFAERSFKVHLDALSALARELETQLEAVGRITDEFGAATGPALLGDFSEATALQKRHQATVEEMRAALNGIRAAIGFAEDVTKLARTGYETHDRHVADSFRSGPTPGTAAAPSVTV